LSYPVRFATLCFSSSRLNSVRRRLADSREPFAWTWTSMFSAESARRSWIGTVILTISSAPILFESFSQTNFRSVPSRLVKGNKPLAKSNSSAAIHTACHPWSKILAWRKCSPILSKFSISCFFWLDMVYFCFKSAIVSRSRTEPTTTTCARETVAA